MSAIAFFCDAQNITTVYETRDQATFSVTVTGVKKNKAYEPAESALRYALFFRGIPDSKYCNTALVGTDEKIAAKNSRYFKEMFEDNRFASFITNGVLDSYVKKDKVSTFLITVNMKALRLDLEAQGVKRRFGI